jgi:hypothetical protein
MARTKPAAKALSDIAAELRQQIERDDLRRADLQRTFRAAALAHAAGDPEAKGRMEAARQAIVTLNAEQADRQEALAAAVAELPTYEAQAKASAREEAQAAVNQAQDASRSARRIAPGELPPREPDYGGAHDRGQGQLERGPRRPGDVQEAHGSEDMVATMVHLAGEGVPQPR